MKKKTINVVLLPYSAGSLGRNNGCEAAPGTVKEIIGKLAEEYFKGKIKLDFSYLNLQLLEPEEALKRIEKEATRKIGNAFTIFVGGDHSISYATIKAFAKKYKRKTVVWLDSHADAMDCLTVPSHEDVTKTLVERKIIKRNELIFFGLQRVWPREKKFIEKRKIVSLQSRDLPKLEKLIKGKQVYLSIDFDVFNKRIAFATGYADGKLKMNEFTKLWCSIADRIRVLDFVEYNPLLDKNNTGQKLIERIFKIILKSLCN
ncbi:MAG: arginase family protein [Candidatus Diapherotrites archaeon]|nr:arginase family protein [Candidatus Diapherotrites archaeon]